MTYGCPEKKRKKKRAMCVRDRRAYSMTLRKTNEHRAGKRETVSQKLCPKLQGKRGNKKSKQLPSSVPANERFPPPTCVSNERWTALLSILSSKKSAMMSPWTHLEPTSVKKHYPSPPSPLPHFLFHLSPSFPLHFVPATPILLWAPIFWKEREKEKEHVTHTCTVHIYIFIFFLVPLSLIHVCSFSCPTEEY